jgi:FtsH-binding integral membrane protein
MANWDRNTAYGQFGTTVSRAEQAVLDEGLRSYMLRVYNFMAIGLAITGLAAIGTFMLATTTTATGGMALTPIGMALYSSPLKWVVMLAPLAFVFFLGFKAATMRPQTAMLTFFAFAVVMGLSLSSIFLVYTHGSIARVFFITAAAFGTLSLWGYTTKRDLTGMGTFLIMGLFGIVIASLVNLFLGSSGLQWVISIAGVLIFSGLTAYDTQRLKTEYLYGNMDGDTMEKSAILGALSLYLNFINLFTVLLQLFGQREE